MKTKFIHLLLLLLPVAVFSQEGKYVLDVATCKAQQDRFFEMLKKDTINYEVGLQEDIYKPLTMEQEAKLKDGETPKVLAKRYKIFAKTESTILATFLGFKTTELAIYTNANGKNVIMIEASFDRNKDLKETDWWAMKEGLPNVKYSIMGYPPLEQIYHYPNRLLSIYEPYENKYFFTITVMRKNIHKAIKNWLVERREWALRPPIAN